MTEPLDDTEANNLCVAPSLPRFTQPLHVHVVRLDALAGVLFKYALADERKRSEFFTGYPLVTPLRSIVTLVITSVLGP